MSHSKRSEAEQAAYDHLVKVITKEAVPILENGHQYDDLIEKIGDARFVLLGEATHGTKEFYQARVDISKRLIEEKGFMAIAIEGDWPDTCVVHRYLQGVGDKDNDEKALSAFTRFPIWMWRNKTVSPFLRWLRNYNDQLTPKDKIGFFGLDLYSLNTSMKAVIDYLLRVDPEAAKHAKKRYACFDHVNVDPQSYGYLISEGLKKPCAREAFEQMLELQNNVFEYLKKDGLAAEDEYFYAIQNARVVQHAENYYRTMFDGRVSSWNNRDKHMAETLENIIHYLENRLKKPAKMIVWAHNSHLGDARATEMGAQGELNIGQLVRERHGKDTYSIGFSTYEGTVMAAPHWDAPGKVRKIVPGLHGSYEELFHHVPYDQFSLTLRGNKELEHYLHPSRLQRAIGVIYAPHTERFSHYFFVQLPNQFDSIIHIDKTTAIEPLRDNHGSCSW